MPDYLRVVWSVVIGDSNRFTPLYPLLSYRAENPACMLSRCTIGQPENENPPGLQSTPPYIRKEARTIPPPHIV